jgi:DNA-binding Lrp family transcriptional regulator
LAETIVNVVAKEKGAKPAVTTDTGETKSESAYYLIRLNDDADIFECYRILNDMPNVLYSDTTKGDYDIFILAQTHSIEKLEEMAETLNKLPFVKSMDYMRVEIPVLSENVASIISVAEEALLKEAPAGKTRAQAQRISSYLLMEVEREKMEDIYPVLKLNEFVVYCDYTVGKYNLVLFVSANLFDQIDTFIHKTLVNMNGILKIKEYPIVNILQM